MGNQSKPINKEYLVSSLKGFDKNILNKKYQKRGVQPDWDEENSNSESYIKNKPSALPASDVAEWAKEENKPEYSKEEIGLGNVDNTSDDDKPISIAQQEELDKKINKTTVATDSTLGLIKSGEDIDVDNNGNVSVKDNSHNHKVENISDLSASASELNVLDGITASTGELNHTTGVTDNIQTQLDGKAPITHTHDDRYYTESEIEDKLTEKFADLENVDNTADIDKPVSTAQQNAINSAVSEHDTSSSSHSDIRSLISDLTAKLNTLADSDDTTLDQLSEIVAYIKNNKDLIDGVTTSKVSVSDIIDGLTSTAMNKPLSANQGKILNDLITALTTSVGDKVDKVSGKGLSTNDYTTAEKNKLDGIASGAEVNVQPDWDVTDTGSDAYIKNKPTSMPASDVYEWAKAQTKPEYSKEDVGLGNVGNFKAVSTVANQSLSSTEKINARNNLGIGGPGTQICSVGNSNSYGKSINYSREDHKHAMFNSDGHEQFVELITPPADMGVGNNWYAYTVKVLTLEFPCSWLQSLYFTIKILVEDKDNPILEFEGEVTCDFVRIISMKHSGIDNVFKIGTRKVSNTKFEIYLEIDEGNCGLSVYGDIFAVDVPSISYEPSNEIVTDTNVLSKIDFIQPSSLSKWCGYDIYTQQMFPIENNSHNIGHSTLRYKMIYLSSSPNISSDRNVKTNIQPVSDKFVEFFNKLMPVSFQFIDGNSGRTHIGFISQDVEKAMADVGLDDIDFAGFCKDKITKVVTNHVPLYDNCGAFVLDRTGNPKTKAVTEVVDDIDENGNVKYFYSLRYEEFIALNTAVIQRQQLRINGIEDRVSRIEERIGL